MKKSHNLIKFISLFLFALSLSFFFVKITRQVLARNNNSNLDFEQIEKDILQEMNQARTNPQAYVDKLENFKTYFRGLKRHLPGKATVLTTEGVKAVDDAIAYIQNIEPLNPLTLSTGMSQAARDHVIDQGNTGKLGHIGSDKSKPHERMSRYGKWHKKSAENISYGPDTGEQVIMSLIVDDGVYDRGHRKNIMNPLYQVTGVACGRHPQYQVMCVTTFAVGYQEQSN